jgi:polysaccharide export outer membrane protein
MPLESDPGNPDCRLLAGALLLGFLLVASPTLADPVTSLVEVRPDGRPGSFLLVCDGSFQFTRAEDPDPRRVVVELAQVRNAVKDRRIRVGSELVRSISITETRNPPLLTRVVFELERPNPVSLRPEGEVLAVVVGQEPEEDAAPAAPDAIVGTAMPARVGRPAGDEAATADYVIGGEDLIEINVFEQPDLNRTVRVSGEGTIRIPLVGVIPVSGLTTQQAEARIRDLLAEKYLTDPQVSLFVKEARSKKVSVVGAVEKPGTIEMLGRRTLLEAISEAGGLTQQAGRELHVLRPDSSGAATRIDVDLDDLMIHGNPELNIPILPGDVINVPIDRILHVYVDGAVRKPGEVEYKSSRPLNLLQAIAAAGGLSERASQKGILVIRNSPGGLQERLEVDLKAVRKGKEPNLMLRNGDTVYVPETFF